MDKTLLNGLSEYNTTTDQMLYLAGYANELFAELQRDEALRTKRPSLFLHVEAWLRAFDDVSSFRPPFLHGEAQANEELNQ